MLSEARETVLDPQARFTLCKADKLKTKSEFDAVKSEGSRISNELFTFLSLPVRDEVNPRCGVICSRKFHKRAVVRNRARRLLWESFRLLKKRISPCWMILIPKRKILNAGMPDVKSALNNALEKLENVQTRSQTPG